MSPLQPAPAAAPGGGAGAAAGATPRVVAQHPATRALWLLLVAHVLVWTLVPALTYRTLPQDTLEGLVWGRQWQFGYDKHPFLAPWLTALFTDTSGVVGWPAFLASQLAVAGCFLGVWQLARTRLGHWDAFNAVALLEGIHYYTVSSFTFNPNLLMLPTWAWLAYTVWRAVQRPSALRWAAAGLCTGLALDSKYSVALLLAALGLQLASCAPGRRALASRGFGIAALVAALVFAPNLAWLMQHDFLPLHYAAHSLAGGADAATGLEGAAPGRWQRAVQFLGEQAASVLPVLLLFAIAYGLPRARRNRQAGGAGARAWIGFDDAYLLAAAAGPLLLTLLIALLFDATLVARWGFPYLSWSGIVLVRWRGAGSVPARAPVDAHVAGAAQLPADARLAADARMPSTSRRLIVAIIATTLLLAAGNYWVIDLHPQATGRPPYSILFPARALAARVGADWQQRYGTPLRFVAARRWTAAAICAYSAARPAPYFDWAPQENPAIDPTELERAGAAFVVELKLPEDEGQIAALQERYPRLEGAERIEVPYQGGARFAPERFWIAFLPPRQNAPGAASAP